MLFDVFCKLVAVATAVSYLYLMPTYGKLHWETIVQVWGGPKEMYVWGTLTLHAVTLAAGNLFFLVLYVTDPSWLHQFKINPQPWPWQQDAKNRSKFFSLVRQSLLFTILNGVIISGSSAYFAWPVTQKVFDASMETFPSLTTVFCQLIFFILIEDATFYWVHRLLHHKSIYKYIHKMHHNYYYSVSIAVEHLHPVEFIVANLLPMAVGPALVKAHCFTYWMWIHLRIIQTIEAHSGYKFPWSPFRLLPLNEIGDSHDLHHSKNTGNFGSFFGFWDTVFGTRILDTPKEKL